MFARVIPLKRLPRSLGAFDYTVPKDLRKKIKRGQLVTIPFRQSIAHGLVLSTSIGGSARIITRNNAELKQIQKIVHAIPLLGDDGLQFIETMSQWYGASLGTIASMCVLPLQKRKLTRITLKQKNTKTPKHKNTKTFFSLYQTRKEHEEMLCRVIQGATLILVPEVHLIQEVFDLLPSELQKQTVIWHSELSTKEKFERWLLVRNSELQTLPPLGRRKLRDPAKGGDGTPSMAVANSKLIVIGTRSTVFLPFQKLDAIIIDYEHDENHKHWDQTPRFHVKDVAGLLQQLHGARLHLMSFTPSSEAYFHVHKGNYLLSETSGEPKRGNWKLETQNSSKASKKNTFKFQVSNFKIIDLLDERRAGRFGILADEIESAIANATGDVFLFVPRRGLATAIGCNDCGRVEKCPVCELPYVFHNDGKMRCHYCRASVQPPKSCANCNHPALALSGAGTQAVEKLIWKLLGEKYDILRIDSESPDAALHGVRPMAIVGTEMALASVRWRETSVIVFVDADKMLGIPEYAAGEKAWHLLGEVQFRKSPGAEVYVQTRNPRHQVLRGLLEPDRFYRMDLNARRNFQYPPYSYSARYLFSHADAAAAKKESSRVFAELQKKLSAESVNDDELTEIKKSIIILNPVELQPKYFRGQYWWAMIARLPPKTWPAHLVWLNKQIPVNWKIDPNPVSLLAP